MAVKELSDRASEGVRLGQSATDKVAFWGKTPITQPAATAQSSFSTDVFSLTGTYNSTIIIASLTALHTLQHAMRTALVNAGIIKGAA
jgi:hypothetical protein